MLSPKNIENAWIQFEENLSASLSKKKWFKPFLFFTFIAISLITFNLWTQSHFPQWSRFTLLQDRLWATYVLIFLSFIPLFILPLRNSISFLFFTVCASWLFPIYQVGSHSYYALLPILYLVLCALIVNFLKWNRWIKSSLVFGLFLLLVSFLTRNIIDSQNNKILLYFSNIHMDLVLLYFVGGIFNKNQFPLQLHFNPVQFFAPNPLPENTRLSTDVASYDKQFVRGVLGIIQTQIIFTVLIFVLRSESIATTQDPFTVYVLFIFTILGAMKMISSVLWIYGIKSVSATHFILLAKSPIEVWQRGAVFIADFLFNRVYLPTWKLARNMWLSSALVVFAILFHLFIFHEWIVKAVLRWQFGEMFGSFGWAETKKWSLWLSAWLIWILFFYGFQRSTKALHPSPVFQWLMIILTHLGSSMIFPITLYLARVI